MQFSFQIECVCIPSDKYGEGRVQAVQKCQWAELIDVSEPFKLQGLQDFYEQVILAA